MLEQMGKAGAALRLGADADVVEHGDAHDGSRSVRRQDDPQAVGQRHMVQVE